MDTAETTESRRPTTERQQSIELPLGLLGFEQLKEWRLFEKEDELPFRWLQAASDPSLTFLIVPAFDVLPQYQPDIHDDDVAFLGLENAEDAAIFGIVTLRAHGKATVNLKGPIILNRLTGRGKQVVLQNATEYALQHPLPCGE
ncbi:MAG: flagellar assembly protein FliW [Verrucomicrobiia bacterium]